MANKKVCIFSAQYLPHMGGVERYTLNLCKKLIENGNEAVVVTSQIEDYSNYDGGDYQATTSTQATSTGRVETTTEAPTTAAPTTAAPTTEAPTTASQSQDNNSSKEQ